MAVLKFGSSGGIYGSCLSLHISRTEQKKRSQNDPKSFQSQNLHGSAVTERREKLDKGDESCSLWERCLVPLSCVHWVPSRDERLPLTERKWEIETFAGYLLFVILFFSLPERNPLDMAYVSSCVDTDILLPRHLVALLMR